MAKRRVLVTGAAGYVASQVLPTFRERYECTLVDVRDHDRNGEVVPGVEIADLTVEDLDVNRRLFQDIDAVVHFGFVKSPPGHDSFARASFYTERANVDMAFNVYQMAMEAGVRRVVVASSNHAADWYEGLIHARKKDVVDPWERAISDNYYGWAKEAYEHLGFVFACGKVGRALEVVQLRIGAPREIDAASFVDQPVAYHRDLGAYLSARDLTQLCVKSIETEDIRDRHGIPFQIFYGISDNTRKFWSITNAREVIGYSPDDDSEVKFSSDIQRLLIPLQGPVPATDFNPGPGTI